MTSRSSKVFLLLAGLFLGSLTMLNILGTSRFIDFSFYIFGTQIPFVIAIGVLPYPITFLCTDLISELFGKKKANMVVWTGLILYLWVLFIVWIAGYIDAPDELIDGELPISINNGKPLIPHGYEFYPKSYHPQNQELKRMILYMVLNVTKPIKTYMNVPISSPINIFFCVISDPK